MLCFATKKAKKVDERAHLESVIDFYFLDAVCSLPTSTARNIRRAQALKEEAKERRGWLARDLIEAIRNYLFVAAFAEAGNAVSVFRVLRKEERVTSHLWVWAEIPENEKTASIEALKYNPDTNIPKLESLFRLEWDGCYGGESWADICWLLRRDAKMLADDVVYLDHLIDVQHNGGYAFDKNHAAKVAGLKLCNLDVFEKFLNVKANDDLLEGCEYLGWPLATDTLDILQRAYEIWPELGQWRKCRGWRSLTTYKAPKFGKKTLQDLRPIDLAGRVCYNDGVAGKKPKSATKSKGGK